MFDELKGQHLSFAWGETLSRKFLWAPQWKCTSLNPIHPLNGHQQNKPGLQTLSPKLFQVNQSFKGYFNFQQLLMPLHGSARVRGEIGHGWTSDTAELHVHPWEREVEQRGIRGEQTVRDYWRKKSHLSILRKSSHSKQSQLYSFRHQG